VRTTRIALGGQEWPRLHYPKHKINCTFLILLYTNAKVMCHQQFVLDNTYVLSYWHYTGESRFLPNPWLHTGQFLHHISITHAYVLEQFFSRDMWRIPKSLWGMHTGTEGSNQESLYVPQDEPLRRLAEANGQIRPYWRAPKDLERDSGLNVRTAETAQH